ncbi:hypothetical protein Glove_606g156 [Diversispora epigaea]|uniref:Protein kinase domain-containing protein n=1 Tax=Diversispora epigaea TaxID=1348612 RepID=A0A397GB62_9GLOM|nr:hypothetical protein Glove_606g156 [Diversispora epigaea]
MSFYGTCPECNQKFTDYSWCKSCNSKHSQNDFKKWTSGNNTIDKFILDAQQNATNGREVIEWISYNRFKDIKEIAKGGFGTIYKARWIYGPIESWDVENQWWKRWGQQDVALKKFNNSFASLNEEFLNEDPETNEYIMVLEYMRGGNLRDYLKNNFNNINWKMKLGLLTELASKLKNIHELDIIHHDFHPGNILSYIFENSLLKISDFGLSKLIGQDIKNPEKRQIFGVLPYIDPEVLSGEEYTKASDVYSFGIIAYEMVTGFAPYYDIPHNKDLARKICNGLRPKIPFHIPKLITRLIMRCWDARVIHRPTFKELNKELQDYFHDYLYNFLHKNNKEIAIQIKQAENFSKNQEKGLIRDNKSKSSKNSTTPTPITPKNYRTHPEAIYTSRLLNYSNLPKPKNDKNFEKELEELTKSTSALSVGKLIMRCWDARVIHRPTFKELNKELQDYFHDYLYNFLHKNNKEIAIQIKQAENFSKNQEKGLIRDNKSKSSKNSTTPTPITPKNYRTHPEAIYTSRLLNYSNLPKPKNDKNFEKELEELTKSTSALSVVASKPVGRNFFATILHNILT